jgi:hypothetical protein
MMACTSFERLRIALEQRALDRASRDFGAAEAAGIGV